MPAAEIKPYLANAKLSDLGRVKAYWKVSIKSLIKRTYDLKIITDHQYKSMSIQYNKIFKGEEQYILIWKNLDGCKRLSGITETILGTLLTTWQSYYPYIRRMSKGRIWKGVVEFGWWSQIDRLARGEPASSSSRFLGLVPAGIFGQASSSFVVPRAPRMPDLGLNPGLSAKRGEFWLRDR